MLTTVKWDETKDSRLAVERKIKALLPFDGACLGSNIVHDAAVTAWGDQLTSLKALIDVYHTWMT